MRKTLNATLHAALLAATLGLSMNALADTVITSTGKAEGVAYPFSTPDEGTATFGQIFTAPNAGVLNSATFYVASTNGAAVNFQLYVYAWDGTDTTGNALYTSPVETILATDKESTVGGYPGGAANLLTVSGIDTSLTAGDAYIFVLSTLGDSNPPVKVGKSTVTPIGEFEETSATSGFAVNNDSGTVAGLGAGNDWSTEGTSLEYSADFLAATPEPGTLSLMGLGASALVGLARRRLRR